MALEQALDSDNLQYVSEKAFMAGEKRETPPTRRDSYEVWSGDGGTANERAVTLHHHHHHHPHHLFDGQRASQRGEGQCAREGHSPS